MQIENNDAWRGLDLAELSEEMIMEILLRLPAKTLVSLKSVCTCWRNLISSPDFTRKHLHRSCLRDPWIAYYTYIGGYGAIQSFSVQSMLDNPSEPIKFAGFNRGCHCRMVGSCHGLLCLFDGHDCRHTDAILWNPCTGFTFQSPRISGEVSLCGFGYDHLSDTYKLFVVIMKKVASDLEFSTRIYTFGPTSWRRIDDIPFDLFGVPKCDPFVPDNKEGVFFGSKRACTLNWYLCHHRDVVVYFDLDKETYGHFPLPATDSDDDPWKLKRIIHLCVLRNCLSIYYQHSKTQHWIVWQMKEYGNAQSWTKLAIIPFRVDPVYATYIHSRLQPLYILESDVLLAISSSFQIVMCNLNDGSVDFLVIDGSGNGISFALSGYFGSRMVCIYHESLISPNGLQSNSSKMLKAY